MRLKIENRLDSGILLPYQLPSVGLLAKVLISRMAEILVNIDQIGQYRGDRYLVHCFQGGLPLIHYGLPLLSENQYCHLQLL